MKFAPSLELYSYWEALRGARGAPERNDIEPGAIRGVLADTFILEFARERGFPFRVVGARTQAMFGRELRGQPFTDLWRETDRAEAARVIEAAADGAQPFLLGAKGAPAEGTAVELEILILPLRHHGATHARVLGSCAPSVSAPWFGLLPLRPLELGSLRALRPTAGRNFTARSAATGFQRRGHLFVYSSSK